MKTSFKDLGKNITVGAVAALIATSGAAAVAFASVPHSVTGVISACRANADGVIRVIDGEAGATCEASETAMSWASAGDGNSSHSALLRLEPDSEDPTSYVMNPARSRNIVDVKTVNIPDSDGARMLCIKATFDPEVMDVTTAVQAGMGGGASLQLDLRSQGGSNGEVLDIFCGTDYQAMSYLNPSSNTVLSQSISFRN